MLASELPDADVFARRLPEYFPTQLREQFAEAIPKHPLRRQITTTLVVNEVVDGGGVSYAFRLAEEMNASATDAVRAFTAATQHLRPAVAVARDPGARQRGADRRRRTTMMLETRRLLDRASRWLLSNRPQPLAVRRGDQPVPQGRRRARARRSATLLRGAEREAVAKHADELVAQGVPAELAAPGRRAARHATRCSTSPRSPSWPSADAGLDTERSPRETAELYYALSDHLNIDSMLTSISALERGNRWHALARLALRDDMYALAAGDHARRAAAERPGTSADEKIANWEQTNASRLVPGPRRRWRRSSRVGPAGPRDTVGRRPAGAQYGPRSAVSFIAEVRPRWSDMDVYGHVNHANTVTLLEEARIALLFGEAARQGADGWPRAWWWRGSSWTTTRRWSPTATAVRVAMIVREMRHASFTLDYEVHSGPSERRPGGGDGADDAGALRPAKRPAAAADRGGAGLPAAWRSNGGRQRCLS